MDTTPTELQFKLLVDQIGEPGWCVLPDFLGADAAQGLWKESMDSWQEGEFRRAGVGQGENLLIREDVRTDHVMWLNEENTTPAQQVYFELLEKIRIELNQNFFLGLMDFEGHFAVYPEGGFYKPHLDRHRESRDRLVTVILYLNPNWQSGDGGELKIWTSPGEKDGEHLIVDPRIGTLVCFHSGDYWHEVLPAMKTRASITGWFRGRG